MRYTDVRFYIKKVREYCIKNINLLMESQSKQIILQKKEKMSYTLVLKICSSIMLACSSPMYINSFNNHYDCAIRGYEVSKDILQEMGKLEVEKDKIVINFGCHANKINKTPA